MEAKEKKADEPYYPDGGYGWVIVGAIILINVSLLTLVPCFGLIFQDEFDEWGVTSAQTSLLLHLHSSLYCSFGFFTSPFLKLYGMKPVALCGAALMCLGILLSSFATSYVYLIFSTSVLIGLGQGIVMPATYLATYTYFKKRLTLAISFTVTSASLSSIVIPKICDRLLEHVGRKHTVLVLFVISLLSFVGCLLLKPVMPHNEEEGTKPDEQERVCVNIGINNGDVIKSEDVIKELLPQNDNNKRSNSVYQETTVHQAKTSPTTIWSKLFHTFDLHLLQDVPLVIAIIGLGLSFASELNIILMLQFILKKLSLFERSEIATAVSIQSFADIIGRLVVPIGAHLIKAPAKLMYAGALIAATLARTILALWPTEEVLVFGVVALIGLTKGTRAVFQSVILPKYVTLDKIPAANGINMLFTGFVSLVVGPLIGVVHDKSGSYVYALYAASALSMSCVVMWIVEFAFSKSRANDGDTP